MKQHTMTGIHDGAHSMPGQYKRGRDWGLTILLGAHPWSPEEITPGLTFKDFTTSSSAKLGIKLLTNGLWEDI